MQNSVGQTDYRPPRMERWIDGAAGKVEIRHTTGAVQIVDREFMEKRLADLQKLRADAVTGLDSQIAEIEVALETLDAEAGKPARKVDEMVLKEKVAAKVAAK